MASTAVPVPRLARAISIALHPVTVVPAAVALSSGRGRLPLLAALFALALLLGLFVVWSLLTGRVSDVDFSLPAERPRLLVRGAVTTLLTSAILFAAGSVRAAVGIAALTGVLLASLAANRRWKMSLHTALSTLAVGYAWHGGPAVTLAFAVLVPVIAWARVAMGRHTREEVVGGTLLGALAAAAVVHWSPLS